MSEGATVGFFIGKNALAKQFGGDHKPFMNMLFKRLYGTKAPAQKVPVEEEKKKAAENRGTLMRQNGEIQTLLNQHIDAENNADIFYEPNLQTKKGKRKPNNNKKKNQENNRLPPLISTNAATPSPLKIIPNMISPIPMQSLVDDNLSRRDDEEFLEEFIPKEKTVRPIPKLIPEDPFLKMLQTRDESTERSNGRINELNSYISKYKKRVGIKQKLNPIEEYSNFIRKTSLERASRLSLTLDQESSLTKILVESPSKGSLTFIKQLSQPIHPPTTKKEKFLTLSPQRKSTKQLEQKEKKRKPIHKRVRTSFLSG